MSRKRTKRKNRTQFKLIALSTEKKIASIITQCIEEDFKTKSYKDLKDNIHRTLENLHHLEKELHFLRWCYYQEDQSLERWVNNRKELHEKLWKVTHKTRPIEVDFEYLTIIADLGFLYCNNFYMEFVEVDYLIRISNPNNKHLLHPNLQSGLSHLMAT